MRFPSTGDLPPGRFARQKPKAAQRITVGELVRAVLQVAIVIVVVWRGISRPDLTFLPLVAAGGLLLAGLAAWDDRSRERYEARACARRDARPWCAERRSVTESEFVAQPTSRRRSAPATPSPLEWPQTSSR